MDEALWAFGRASGFVSLALFTVTVLLGIVNRSGRPLLTLPRFSVTILHRNMALLATVFLGLHVGSLMLDSYAKLNPIDVVVPFLGSFKPFWQGLGTVALDLVLAVVVTALVRQRIGQGRSRRSTGSRTGSGRCQWCIPSATARMRVADGLSSLPSPQQP